MSNAAVAVSRAEGGTPDPVKAVSVVSTGIVEIRPEHAFGTSKPLYWWLLTSRSWLPLALQQRLPDLVVLPARDPTAAQRLLGS